MEQAVIKCPVEGCGKEYKNNAGLSSHMAMTHNLSRDGQPLPKDHIEQRKIKLSAAVRKSAATRKGVSNLPMHSPESRAKAGLAISATRKKQAEAKAKVDAQVEKALTPADTTARYKLLAAKGIHRCPECSRFAHRSVDFTTAVELGRHRRFKHGILGLKRHKNLQHAANRKLAETRPEQSFQCPQCQRLFKNEHGLSIHINRKHQADPNQILDATTPALSPNNSEELIHGNNAKAGTAITTLNGHADSKRRSHTDDASFAQAIAVAHIAGNIESLILATANEYDLPPRQFAKRVIFTLGEHYSSER